jgi:hypothetical protein
MKRFGGLDDLVRLRLPGLRDLLEQLEETRKAVAGFRREISAAVERLQLGREKDVQRPPAALAHRLHGGHVDLVHVGPLFAVQLDADEMVPQERRHLFALERFPFHDVAPVTGRITDAEEDGFLLRPRLGEGLLAPRKPVHGIVRVLQEVGRLLADEAVGVTVGCGWIGHGGNRSFLNVTPWNTGRQQQRQPDRHGA